MEEVEEAEDEYAIFDRTGLTFFLDTVSEVSIEDPIDTYIHLEDQHQDQDQNKKIDSTTFDKYVPVNFGLPNANQNWKLSKFLEKDILNTLPLTETQIDALSDVLDWDIISSLELSGPMFVKHKDRINWEIFLQNGHPKEINFLLDVQEKLVEHQYLFFHPRMKKKYYNTPFILVFSNLIDWKWLVKNVKLDEYVLLKFWDKFKPNDISRYQLITYNIAKQKLNSINWIIAGKHPMQEEVIYIAHDYLVWATICKRQKGLSEELLVRFANRLHWKNVSRYQRLTPNFIRKYRKKLDMQLISQYQDLPVDLIKELEDLIDFSLLVKNKNYNKPNKIQITTNGKNYFIIEPPPLGNMPKVGYYTSMAVF
jgi:hypothetical protein